MIEIRKHLNFIKEVEGLKSVTRTAWMQSGRQESTAEHSWRLALFAAITAKQFPELDYEKVLFMSLIHDLGERYSGDQSAVLLPDKTEKEKEEKMAVKKLASFLPLIEGNQLIAVWNEYEEGVTKEALFVKALDKAETIIQHNQGENPPDFDYEFNLTYGLKHFEQEAFLKSLRVELDRETRNKLD
ncbi:HD domain-containing protein [Paenibacillus lutimineralis]|uniref:5'-deoxynucleotidase n=1 Tax=Paenibacillus lutimineralis TaxID=2707005 RepID=A0A3Q9I8Z4_9BACL|nr:HD domain-containing protein [Paenibacillus lutimineralis]AZS15432.1 HD domain-containing protein [Paenibacillus lutimineralis]